MSLFPLLYSDWWEDLDRPHHVRDQHFGMDLRPEHLNVLPEMLETRRRSPLLRHHAPSRYGQGHYYRPWGELLRRGGNDGGVSTVKCEKDKFEVVLDVQQFAPEEITVKVVEKQVVVEGNHDEKQDEHGWISRKFTRRYMIPEQCDLDKVESRLSSDGVLTISAPRKELKKTDTDRIINIEHTGKPVAREQPQEEKKMEEEAK